MKYFRYYPWGLQLLMFVLTTFTLASFGIWCLGMLSPQLAGLSLTQVTSINEQSPYYLVKVALIVQGISSLFIFAVPSLLFSYFTHPKWPGYLGLRKPGNLWQPVLAVGLILGAMPLLMGIESLISQIDFGADVKQNQARTEGVMKAFLKAPAFIDFIRIFIVMAIIPAVGEELFFRGILMRFATRAFNGTGPTPQVDRSLRMATLLSALVFAAVHSNVYGLFSIFIAGVLLSTIYFLTGSIWCSIIAHMSFNGSQVILSYLGNNNAGLKSFLSSGQMPLWLLATGTAVFSMSLYLLIKIKTPLPPTWTNDFDEPDPPMTNDTNDDLLPIGS
ncbi:MAG: CPBP family intramembrane metalloprotease [Taibaiella sp.]|nr:CPBP family intramembrane metalloprotease [Taibaiella sp.]